MHALGPRRSDRLGAVRGAWLPALLLIVPGVVAGLFWRTTTGRPVAADGGAAPEVTVWSRASGGGTGTDTLLSTAAASESVSTREPLPGGLRLGTYERSIEEPRPDPLAVFEEGSRAALEAGDAEWLAGYRELAALGTLDAIALRDLRSPVATVRKAVLLRVLYETDSKTAAEGFRLALAKNENTPPPAGGTVDLATFAVHHLDQRAAREPRARALLREYLQSGAAGAVAGERVDLRSRAARSLGRTTPATDFDALAEVLAGESDTAVLQAALRGLCQNPEAVAEPGPFLALGFDPPARIEPERTEP